MQVPDRSILIKCLSGEASPEEAALLDTWLNAAPGNRQEFEAVWQLWQKTTGRTVYVPPDVGKEWQDLQLRIHPASPAPTPRPGKIPVRSGIWKVVSAVIAGSVITGIVLISRHQPVEHPRADHQPGEHSGAGHHPSGYPPVVRHSDQAVLKDTLPDGTIITLDEQGIFSRPSPGHGRQDTVSLIKGKAYVQADARPLTIGAGEVSVSTKDGDFLLINDSATGDISVEVSRGIVEVRHGAGNYRVQKGNALFYDAKRRRFTEKSSVDINSVAFATGVFSFTNTSLKELTAVLSRAYKVEIRLNNPAIGNCRMTVQFDNLPITSVLDIIAATLDIHYSIKQRERLIYINGKGCE